MREWKKTASALAVVVLAGLAAPAAAAVTQQAILSPIGGASDDYFGYSVSVAANYIVAGAYGDDNYGTDAGAAYVFLRNQGGKDKWGQISRMQCDSLAAYDRFGWSVSVDSRGYSILGAPGDDNKGPESGAAYVGRRAAGGGCEEVARLQPDDLSSHDGFGYSVSIDGDIAVVGAYQDDDRAPNAGAAYIFARDEGGKRNWGLITKLYASDAGGSDFFGQSVAINGDFVVVGAPGSNTRGVDSGAAYIFGRDQGGASNWGQVTKLSPSDGTGGDYFGFSVSAGFEEVLIGAYGDDDQGSLSGSAYLFQRDEGGFDNWGLLKKLMPDDGAGGDEFGYSVAISEERAICGAPLDDDLGNSSGSSYVFGEDEGGTDNWGQMEKFYASDAAAGARFGRSVSVFTPHVSVGAFLGSATALEEGEAYAYHAPEPAALGLIGLGAVTLSARRRRKTRRFS